ncbi:MAG TPA: DUF84 family protein, partial [Blastocatellia bacterium]|nr:DUF84 family protein [Blastocatellia bacterium]
MRIGIGSARAAKVAAVRTSAERISALDPAWRGIEIISREVETAAPLMPLSDEELMHGAKARALAVRELLAGEQISADLYVGLEGGFH